MNVWNFEKRAGLILDQQDDPGAGWEMKIAEFWPVDLPMPNLGHAAEDKNCIARVSDGYKVASRYPIDTPENALASSMYFLAFGLDSIQKEAHQTIALGLQNARIAHGVHLPGEFVEFIKEARLEPPEQEIAYADEAGRLPIETPGQCRDSIKVFMKNASRWHADDQMIISRKLQEAAEGHGLEANLPLAATELAKTAAYGIDRRMAVMRDLRDLPGHIRYMTEMTHLKTRLNEMPEYRALLKMASDLEQCDRAAGMDVGWNDYFPDPASTLLVNFERPEFLLKKEAEVDYDSVDYDGLREIMDSDYVDQISEDPGSVIPTLPIAERKIVEDYVSGRSQV
jgi:hypothetical protein